MLKHNEGSLSRDKAFHIIAFFLAFSMTVVNVEQTQRHLTRYEMEGPGCNLRVNWLTGLGCVSYTKADRVKVGLFQR